MTDGSLVIAEEREDGILLRPAVVTPVEIYSRERAAGLLLSNAVADDDYEAARAEVQAIGLDPDHVPQSEARVIRVFLDANILFFAAYRERNGLTRLWGKAGFQLVTSPYTLAEAERNIALKRPTASERLRLLVSQIEITTGLSPLREGHGLPLKDQPILAAALGSNCSVLLTGDVPDFGHLMGKTLERIPALTASMFLAAEPSD